MCYYFFRNKSSRTFLYKRVKMSLIITNSQYSIRMKIAFMDYFYFITQIQINVHTVREIYNVFLIIVMSYKKMDCFGIVY